MHDVTIRIKRLDGVWETLGVERNPSITPENIKYSADQNGSSTASFDLKRDPGASWPDLLAYTPVDIEVDGTLVWSGRVKETPSRQSPTESVINVQCEGWQFHLDDDVYSRFYVRTRLADWQDARTAPTANLTTWTSDLYVNSQDGKITIGAQNGTSWNSGKEVGVYLDLGLNNVAKRIYINAYRTAGTGSNVSLYVRGTDDPSNFNNASFISDAIAGFPLGSVSTSVGNFAGNFSSEYRYVGIFLYNSGAAYGVSASDGNGDVFIMTGIQVFADTTYEGGGVSSLKASTVWADSLDITPNLDRSTDGITTTSFSIPDFSISEPTTPRAAQDAVNAFHNYQRMVDVRRKLIIRPFPTVPLLEAASGSVVTIEDASANSGDDIFNRAVITGTQGDGQQLYVTRTAGYDPTARKLYYSDASEPSLADDGTFDPGPQWSSPGGTATRDTTVFPPNSGASSLKVTGTYAQGAFTDGPFVRGHTYYVTFLIKSTGGSGGWQVEFGRGYDYTTWTGSGINGSTWTTAYGIWAPEKSYALTGGASHPLMDNPGVRVYITGGATGPFWIANMFTTRVAATIADRQGFFRTKSIPLSFPTTSAAAVQLGDSYLAGHRTSPFRGTVAAKGNNSIVNPLTGDSIGAPLAPLFVGELFRLPDRIDPDTGALGREARVANVDVDLNEDTATIALDNTRNNFEALLSRLEVVTSARVQ
jgi:hypothetical protein